MGESSVMTRQKEALDEELFVERLEIVDTEQSGGSESGDGSSDDGENEENHDDITWQGGPDKKK
jgi:hypothetical protein